MNTSETDLDTLDLSAYDGDADEMKAEVLRYVSSVPMQLRSSIRIVGVGAKTKSSIEWKNVALRRRYGTIIANAVARSYGDDDKRETGHIAGLVTSSTGLLMLSTNDVFSARPTGLLGLSGVWVSFALARLYDTFSIPHPPKVTNRKTDEYWLAAYASALHVAFSYAVEFEGRFEDVKKGIKHACRHSDEGTAVETGFCHRPLNNDEERCRRYVKLEEKETQESFNRRVEEAARERVAEVERAAAAQLELLTEEKAEDKWRVPKAKNRQSPPSLKDDSAEVLRLREALRESERRREEDKVVAQRECEAKVAQAIAATELAAETKCEHLRIRHVWSENENKSLRSWVGVERAKATELRRALVLHTRLARIARGEAAEHDEGRARDACPRCDETLRAYPETLMVMPCMHSYCASCANETATTGKCGIATCGETITSVLY